MRCFDGVRHPSCMPTPYREDARPKEARITDDACPDADLVFVFAVAWVAVLARLAHAFVDRADRGSGVVVAAALVLTMPWLVRGAFGWAVRRGGARLDPFLTRKARAFRRFLGPRS